MATVSSVRNSQSQIISDMTQRHNRTMQDLKRSQRDELERLTDTHTKALDDKRKAYKVEIGAEREKFESDITAIRGNNRVRIDNEVKAGKSSVDSARATYQRQMAQANQNAEANLNKIRMREQESVQNIQRKKG